MIAAQIFFLHNFNNILCLNQLTIIIDQSNESQNSNKHKQVQFHETKMSTPQKRRSQRLAESSSKQTPTMLGKRTGAEASALARMAKKIRPLYFNDDPVQKMPPVKKRAQ